MSESETQVFYECTSRTNGRIDERELSIQAGKALSCVDEAICLGDEGRHAEAKEACLNGIAALRGCDDTASLQALTRLRELSIQAGKALRAQDNTMRFVGHQGVRSPGGPPAPPSNWDSAVSGQVPVETPKPAPVEAPPARTCKKCGTSYPPTEEFWRPVKVNRDGLDGTCRTCRRAEDAQHKRQQAARRRELAPQATEKPCRSCGTVLPLSDYAEHPRSVDGRYHQCEACRNTGGRRVPTDPASEFDTLHRQERECDTPLPAEVLLHRAAEEPDPDLLVPVLPAEETESEWLAGYKAGFDAGYTVGYEVKVPGRPTPAPSGAYARGRLHGALGALALAGLVGLWRAKR